MEKFFLIFSFIFVPALADPNCPRFINYYENAKALASLTRGQNLIIESKVRPTLVVGYVNETLTAEQEADAFTLAAQLSIRDGVSLLAYQEDSACLNRSAPVLATRSVYRSIDGYGNNLKYPFRGAAETPFGRFGPKNYVDGVRTIRKTDRTSDYLPSPREIVNKVLKIVKKQARRKCVLNMMLPQFLVALSHDLGRSAPVAPVDPTQRIRCCTAGNTAILPRVARHSACIPITIAKDDSFYSASGTRCMSLVRSQLTSSPASVQPGEIKNRETAFNDLSVFYGSSLVEANKIRTFSQGKIILTPGKTLPVDSSGKFTVIGSRFNIVVTVNTFVVLFYRNHNLLCDKLSVLNPTWTDEQLYQESKRINNAIFQNIAISSAVTDETTGSFTVENYNEEVDPSETVEFQQTIIRSLHFLIPSNLRLINSTGAIRETPQSDLIGRVDILDQFSDDYIRGALNQNIFNEAYTNELHNKFFKGPTGIGLDVYSMDIQRGREQGHPTWIQVREKCGLQSNFTQFSDLITVFPKSTISRLEKVYDSVFDIDLYVGGVLESFIVLNERLLGPTFSCVFRDQYRRMTAGDAYFFTHTDSPNPFTQAQLKSIRDYSVNNLICANTGIERVNKHWQLVDDSSNPKVSCSKFPAIDLNSWKAA